MIEAIARAQGYRTGLFTSPHLVTFRERIQVRGEMIAKAEVAEGLTMIRELVGDWDPHPTFFEIATALGLHHFLRQECDIVVLETGMGGRLDATNAIRPVASVITPIDYDHQKWLGNTLAEIASEKAGIIKGGVPVVSAPQPTEAEAVIRSKAEDCGAALEIVVRVVQDTPVALDGSHQRQNAALAVAALRAANIAVDPVAVTRGLETVSWPARFQRWNDRTIIDGAHNAAGARVLVETWQRTFGDERAVIVLAVLQDKDAAAMIDALIAIAARFVLPHARTERAIPPEELAPIVHAAAPSIRADVSASFNAGLVQAQAASERTLITGSLHFAGEALAALAGNPDDLEDCLQ
jgi:dihydrofolate synthase/folylpolyglutamate synthase